MIAAIAGVGRPLAAVGAARARLRRDGDCREVKQEWKKGNCGGSENARAARHLSLPLFQECAPRNSRPAPAVCQAILEPAADRWGNARRGVFLAVRNASAAIASLPSLSLTLPVISTV